MMEMAGESVVKNQFLSFNRFRTKRSLHDCDGDDGAGNVGMHELPGVGGECLAQVQRLGKPGPVEVRLAPGVAGGGEIA